MKAIILAAGLGTRLGDVGKNTPKCLIHVNGVPLLQRQKNNLNKLGVDEVIVVVGGEGDCWYQESYDEISRIADKIVVNQKNITTCNMYSLKLALDQIDEDDLIIIDGDLFITFELLEKVIKTPGNLFLTKEINEETKPRNKVLLDGQGRVLEVGRHISVDKLSQPFSVFGPVVKIKKEDFEWAKEAIGNQDYKNDLSFFITRFARKAEIRTINTSSGWVNINTVEQVELAAELCANQKFIILMMGYTGVGKSTLAKKLAAGLNADIFHSAIVRQKLSLFPKNVEAADQLFNFNSGLREDMDKQVYGKMANLAENSLGLGKNVILDAGHFFSWQRKRVYDLAAQTGAEVFVVRVTCQDEEEIKLRLENRARKFESSPLNEASSWETYLSSKKITELPEKDSANGFNLIEFDSLTQDIQIIKSLPNSKNIPKIIEAIKSS